MSIYVHASQRDEILLAKGHLDLSKWADLAIQWAAAHGLPRGPEYDEDPAPKLATVSVRISDATMAQVDTARDMLQRRVWIRAALVRVARQVNLYQLDLLAKTAVNVPATDVTGVATDDTTPTTMADDNVTPTLVGAA